MARRDYKFHFIRGRGWQNDCVGYHIKGDIFDADRADSIIEIEGAVDMLVIYTCMSGFKKTVLKN